MTEAFNSWQTGAHGKISRQAACLLGGIAAAVPALVMTVAAAGMAHEGSGSYGAQWWRIVFAVLLLLSALAMLLGLCRRTAWWVGTSAAGLIIVVSLISATWKDCPSICGSLMPLPVGMIFGSLLPLAVLLLVRRPLCSSCRTAGDKWRRLAFFAVGVPAALVLTAVLMPYNPELAVEDTQGAARAGMSAKTPAAPAEGRQVIDLGSIKSESTHEMTFTVANDSKFPVFIRGTFSECTCLKVISYPQSIDPKGTAAIKVQLIAPAGPAHYSQHVFLRTSDPQRPRIGLLVKAEISP